MLKTLRNAWTIPELRRKILFTLFIVFLYRVGAAIPVPFIDYQSMQAAANLYSEGILSYLNILSGYAFSRATLLALSVTPYINASIIMQLLTIAIPALERMSKDGEAGRKKIEKITRYVTLVLAVITSYGYYAILDSDLGGNVVPYSGGAKVFAAIVIIACYTAGACLVMWLGERIDEQGIGNGISMILFANIVAGLPSTFVQFAQNLTAKQSGGYFDGDYVPLWLQIVLWVAVILVLVGSIVFVTYMSDAERRIPVQYAKRTVGRKMYGGQSSNLPIKLNMSGVMPIIFASTIISLPITIMQFVGVSSTNFFYRIFATDSWVYMILLFVLIIAFAYFYISISFNPVEVANNLMQQGGSIPGIRPGRPTALYIKKVLGKIVLMGALFLGIVACFPLLLNIVTGGLLNVISFSGSTLLIVVGVILETVREMEAQMTMRHYKGFLD
ncbi:MAG: preprotein translocase subunit SecY [Clostridiales bacterium]|nr:MAG: preprotein translocase subunit SecY [Clostridiales bacterium]